MLDFQEYVDRCGMECAVLSVECKPDGSCGDIHIICANEAYKQTMGPTYYDGMRYEELVPKDSKFEDFCFRAAILGQPMHTYVETRALGFWTDQILIPLQSDRSDIGYCQFVFEFTKTPEANRMANVSADVASAAIETSVSLMRAEDFRSGLADALQGLLRFSGGFVSRVMIVDHSRKLAINYCEVVTDEELLDDSLGDGVIDYKLVKTWEDMIGVSNAVIVKDEQDMCELEQRNPAWAASMRSYNVTSLVLVPLRRGSSVVGYLFVINFDVEKVVEVKSLLELMSFILGSEIANHVLLDKLEYLSTTDALTGIFNRHAMMQRLAAIDDLAQRRPFGIASIDLNGLKTVNDRRGHEAGDQMLVAAAELLRSIFRHDDLYRIGGDEFLIISTDIPEDVFYSKLDRLHAALASQDEVSFSIGSFWSDGSENAHHAVNVADTHMYADKRSYYERTVEADKTEEPAAASMYQHTDDPA